MSLLNDIANNPFNQPELSTQQAVEYIIRQLKAKFRVPVGFFKKTKNDENAAVTSLNFSLKLADVAVMAGIAKKTYPSMTNKQAWDEYVKRMEREEQERFEEAHGREPTYNEWENIFVEQVIPDLISEVQSAAASMIKPIVDQFPDIASVHPTSFGVDLDTDSDFDNPEFDCQIIIRLRGKTK